MKYRDKENLRNPNAAMATFRDWCLRNRVTPENASMEDLDRFGEFLLERDFTYDEMQECKYVIFQNL